MFRSMTVVAALSVASVAFAQTPVDTQVSSDALRQVKSMESQLVSAVSQAASKLNARAVQAVPDFKLRFETSPAAIGWVLPDDGGMFFFVVVPGIEATSQMLWSRSLELQPRNPAQPMATVNPAMPAAMTNPGLEYSNFARQAIVEAMLDAITLPLKEGQKLTVSVGSSPDPSNPLATDERRLYLILKAEDLMALRANTITRDQAKARIIEKRY